MTTREERFYIEHSGLTVDEMTRILEGFEDRQRQRRMAYAMLQVRRRDRTCQNAWITAMILAAAAVMAYLFLR